MSPRVFAPLRLCVSLPFFLLAGCGLPSRSYVPVHTYTLDPAPAEAPSPPERPAVPALAVAPLAAPSHYGERIFYRSKNHAAGTYENDRWVAPPAELLTRALVRTLARARVAEAVGPDSLLRDADLLLAGELATFDIVRDARDCVAECEVHLVLKDLRTRTVLLAERFAAARPVRKPAVPVAKPGVPAMVEAMNQAAGDVLAQATQAVAQALADRPEPTGEAARSSPAE